MRTALQDAGDLHLLDESCDSHNLFHQCRQLTPNVLLLQLNLLENNFDEWMMQLRAACPTTRILLLIDPGQEDAIEIQKIMQMGGGGAILSDESIDMLHSALRTVGHGGVWFSQVLLHKFMQQGAPQPSAAEASGLTEKELAIVHLLVQGKTDYEIAQEQGIAERTVRYYLQRICDKLGVDTRVKIAVQALKQGIVDDTSML